LVDLGKGFEGRRDMSRSGRNDQKDMETGIIDDGRGGRGVGAGRCDLFLRTAEVRVQGLAG